MKKSLMFVLVGVLLIGMTGFTNALTIYNTSFELSDWGWQKYTKLIEPDDTCEECAVFAPLDDLVDNGDGTGNTTIYVNGEAQVGIVVFNSTTGYPKLVSGVIGNAFEFDGNRDWAYVQNSWMNATTLELLVWVYVNDSKRQFILSQHNWVDPDGNGNEVQGFWIEVSNGDIGVRWGDGYSDAFTEYINTNILGVWTLVDVLIRDNGDGTSTVKVFVNNDKVYEVTTNVGFAVYDRSLAIGATHSTTGGNELIGKVDEVRVYTRELSNAERTLIYNLGRYKLSLWQGNEADLPEYLNATLFCPLDSLDTMNNVTKCYLNKSLVNVTVYAIENVSLVSGIYKNAIKFGTNSYAWIDRHTTTSTSFAVYALANVSDDGEKHRLITFQSIGTAEWGYIEYQSDYNRIRVGFRNDDLSSDIIDVPVINGFSGTLQILAYYDGDILHVYMNDANTHYTFDHNESLSYFLSSGWGQVFIGLNAKGIAIDEAYVFYNVTFTKEDVQKLFHLGRHKTATLSAPSATYDGSQFLVNITAQLPGDGKSYVLPAPLGAQGLTAIGQIGNFTFLNVGTAGEVSYTFTATPGQAVPGLAYLGIETDNSVYAYGTGNMTLSVQRTKLFYNNNDAPVNIITSGKVTAVSWSGLKTLQEIKASTLELLSGDGQVRVDKFSLEDTKLNVPSLTNPIKIRATLLPVTKYKITRDLNLVQEANTNEDAVMTFVLDNTGAWEVFKAALGASIAMDYIMKVMLATIIVAIFAMLVVEKTPVKFDDNATKAIIAMITIVILVALVKVLILTR